MSIESNNEIEAAQMFVEGYAMATIIYFFGEEFYREFIEKQKAFLAQQ